MKKLRYKIFHELKEHIPFTAFATLIAVLFFSALVNKVYTNTGLLFDIFHPAHIFFSSIVSAAIFYKYRNKIWLALASSVIISIFIASISDIIFPYLGSLMFNMPISFHLPLTESPILILSIGIIGSLIGIYKKITKMPHFLHVFVSVFASLLYIFTYNGASNVLDLFLIAVIVFVSVIIPCCLSDIVFPLIFQEKIRR